MCLHLSCCHDDDSAGGGGGGGGGAPAYIENKNQITVYTKQNLTIASVILHVISTLYNLLCCSL